MEKTIPYFFTLPYDPEALADKINQWFEELQSALQSPFPDVSNLPQSPEDFAEQFKLWLEELQATFQPPFPEIPPLPDFNPLSDFAPLPFFAPSANDPGAFTDHFNLWFDSIQFVPNYQDMFFQPAAPPAPAFEFGEIFGDFFNQENTDLFLNAIGGLPVDAGAGFAFGGENGENGSDVFDIEFLRTIPGGDQVVDFFDMMQNQEIPGFLL